VRHCPNDIVFCVVDVVVSCWQIVVRTNKKEKPPARPPHMVVSTQRKTRVLRSSFKTPDLLIVSWLPTGEKED